MTVCPRIQVSSCYPVHDSTTTTWHTCAVSLEIGFYHGVYKIKSVTFVGLVVSFHTVVHEILTKYCFKCCFYENVYYFYCANYPEKAGVLKINSYYFKGFRKPLLQSWNSFQQWLVPYKPVSRSQWGWHFFTYFFIKFPFAFGNSLLLMQAALGNLCWLHEQLLLK